MNKRCKESQEGREEGLKKEQGQKGKKKPSY
jgi:hypothetical protein